MQQADKQQIGKVALHPTAIKVVQFGRLISRLIRVVTLVGVTEMIEVVWMRVVAI